MRRWSPYRYTTVPYKPVYRVGWKWMQWLPRGVNTLG